MNTATYQFIQTHADADPHSMTLAAKRYPEVDMPFAVRQIAARQRIRSKLPEFHEQLYIEYPPQLSLEQCSSEQTARHKAQLISGHSLVDLTGGFGVDFFYMSQQVTESYYVERQTELCHLARKNFDLLGLKGFTVVNEGASDFITRMPTVDWVYIDPHRRDSTGRKTVLISDCDPNLTLLIPEIMDKCSHILVKLSPMLDIHRAIIDLPTTRQIDIIAVENECKELLFILDKEPEITDRKIRCFNYQKNKPLQLIEFSGLKDVATAAYTHSPLEFLYEPNVAIVKSGAYNAIAQRFGILKFHPNTHLYTSSTYIENFPGRIFRVCEVVESSKQRFVYLKDKYERANISVRNYPMSSDELRKKTKLNDGGDWYLFAFKNSKNQNIITICTKS